MMTTSSRVYPDSTIRGHGLRRPRKVQGTAQFHDQIANARLPQAAPVFDTATVLHTPVDLLDPEPASVQGLVSVSPTLCIGSIKMKQYRSSQRTFSDCILVPKKPFFPLLSPTCPLTGGTYGPQRQEDQTHSRRHAPCSSPCRRH